MLAQAAIAAGRHPASASSNLSWSEFLSTGNKNLLVVLATRHDPLGHEPEFRNFPRPEEIGLLRLNEKR